MLECARWRARRQKGCCAPSTCTRARGAAKKHRKNVTVGVGVGGCVVWAARALENMYARCVSPICFNSHTALCALSRNRKQRRVPPVLPRSPKLSFPLTTPLARLRSAAPALVAAAGLGARLAYSSGEDHIEPPHYKWAHNGPFTTFDAAAIREPSAYPDGPNSPESIKSPYGQGFTRAAGWQAAQLNPAVGKFYLPVSSAQLFVIEGCCAKLCHDQAASTIGNFHRLLHRQATGNH